MRIVDDLPEWWSDSQRQDVFNSFCVMGEQSTPLACSLLEIVGALADEYCWFKKIEHSAGVDKSLYDNEDCYFYARYLDGPEEPYNATITEMYGG